MAEVPAPKNTTYFNTLFYYNPGQGTSGGGGNVDTATLLNFPVAQGLESFPVGIQSAGDITFDSDTSANNSIVNVYDINFMNKAQFIASNANILIKPALSFPDGSTQTTAFIPTDASYGELNGSNVWTGTNQFSAAVAVPQLYNSSNGQSS